MEPSQHILKLVNDINPGVRLGWDGKKLAIIKIMEPGRHVPTGDRWMDRGPIFGKRHDPCTQVPWALAFYDPATTPWSEIIDIISELDGSRKKSIVGAMEISARDFARMENDLRDDLHGEFGEELHWRAQRADAASPTPVPKKHLSKESKQKLAGEHESQMPVTYDEVVPK